MARDLDTIQGEVEKERDAVAEDLDALRERTSPERFVDQCRTSVQQQLADPKVRYGLIAVGVLGALAVLHTLFADADAPPESWEFRRLDRLDMRLARVEEQLQRLSRRPS